MGNEKSRRSSGLGRSSFSAKLPGAKHSEDGSGRRDAEGVDGIPLRVRSKTFSGESRARRMSTNSDPGAEVREAEGADLQKKDSFFSFSSNSSSRRRVDVRDTRKRRTSHLRWKTASSFFSKFALKSQEAHEEDDILDSYLEKSENSTLLRSFHKAISVEEGGHDYYSDGEASHASGNDTVVHSITEERKMRQIFFEALSNSNLFGSIEEDMCDALYDVSVEMNVKKRDVLFRQGQVGALMFVLVDGTLKSKRKRKIHANEVVMIKAGTCISEDAMVSGLEHESTVSVISDTATLFAIHRIEYQIIATKFVKESVDKCDDVSGESAGHVYLERVPILRALSAEQRNVVYKSALVTLEFEPGSIIVPKGSGFGGLYIIERGEVVYQDRVEGIEKQFFWRRQGEQFGECSLFGKRYSSSGLGVDVAASGCTGGRPVRVVKIQQDGFDAAFPSEIRAPMLDLMRGQFYSRLVGKNCVFSLITDLQLSSIVELMEIRRFHCGTTVHGEKCLVIVLDGVLQILEDHSVYTLIAAGECYGDLATQLIPPELLEKTNAWYPPSPGLTVQSRGSCVCGIIREELLYDLGIQTELISSGSKLRSSTSTSGGGGAAEENLKRASYRAVGDIKIEDITPVRRIYTATASKLYFAWHESTRQGLAVKEISVDAGIQGNEPGLGHDALAEVALMQQLSKTLVIPRIVGVSFGSPNNKIIIAMEPMVGGDLKSFMEQLKSPMDMNHFVFYAACAANALKVLGEHKIMHRDIKPANMMLDEEGYLRLIDFGVSKGSISETGRTRTMCGTPKYMAPELAKLILLKGDGYSAGVDWWALGVSLFEFATGMNPFVPSESILAKSSDESTNGGDNEPDNGDEYQAGPSVHIILHRILTFEQGYPSSDDMFMNAKVKHAFETLGPEWDDAKDFILSLMNPGSYQRLGTSGTGVRNALCHPVFKSVNWQSLFERASEPPYTPETPSFFADRPNNTAKKSISVTTPTAMKRSKELVSSTIENTFVGNKAVCSKIMEHFSSSRVDEGRILETNSLRQKLVSNLLDLHTKNSQRD
mmetsp:Transcript_24930/g.40410  ORF Transcript_24930/g.40410 Transcript_24930/m.40410 type:complete len:1051 (-) Transcript_24930:1445-4597(-)|eukprot:CAMPEP_0203754352 /NCGR_PEP_ID=MMETSP0098-20131031/7947_1 /ASSEMBLY_ACC=CAM_ASM_000208 /TAXON_ID=96639 /ORGANISM=" , Strain NY0313808BC1" /LENGTH=1050 /DNA_ID=CAMNT_0050645305 /DNA_START=78 /DNA_END=3230 /DNA_ORIENTATION=-